MSEMRKMRRRNRHKQHVREARVVGGPHNGLLVPVKETDGDFVYPDVLEFEPYTFDPEAWEFRYTPSV
jgi:hypothetical protein